MIHATLARMSLIYPASYLCLAGAGASMLYTQASQSASPRYVAHPSAGGAFSYPTQNEINAARNLQPNNNHEGQSGLCQRNTVKSRSNGFQGTNEFDLL